MRIKNLCIMTNVSYPCWKVRNVDVDVIQCEDVYKLERELKQEHFHFEDAEYVCQIEFEKPKKVISKGKASGSRLLDALK